MSEFWKGRRGGGRNGYGPWCEDRRGASARRPVSRPSIPQTLGYAHFAGLASAGLIVAAAAFGAVAEQRHLRGVLT